VTMGLDTMIHIVIITNKKISLIVISDG